MKDEWMDGLIDCFSTWELVWIC